jgi:hypothetical protein
VTLAELLRDVGSALTGAERRDADSDSEWVLNGTPFAAVSRGAAAGPETAEFRLEPMVLRAALGTPDTAASPRGSEWVAFRPQELDRMATDRAAAWLASAHRFAAARG